MLTPRVERGASRHISRCACGGCVAAPGGFRLLVEGAVAGVEGLISDPIEGIERDGILGGVAGVGSGVLGLFSRLVHLTIYCLPYLPYLLSTIY